MGRLIVLVAVLLSGCAPWAPERSLDSPHYPPPPGSQLVLLEPLAFAPEQVSAWLQDGQVRREGGVDRYRPFCRFELWSRIDRRRTIQPDSFVVERIARTEWAVSAPTLPHLAAVAWLRVGDDTGGPMAYIMSTELFLASERQPDVHRLTCSHWSDVTFPRHLTIAELQRALAGVFRLDLPQ